MLPAVIVVTLAIAASTAAAVPPPSHPGPWNQVGVSVTSGRPGKALHFFRQAQDPTAVAVVVRSSSARPIRLSWFSYCEFQSDDGMTEQHQGTAAGVGSLTVYPPVFAGATLCSVSVNATPPKTGRVAAAVFAY